MAGYIGTAVVTLFKKELAQLALRGAGQSTIQMLTSSHNFDDLHRAAAGGTLARTLYQQLLPTSAGMDQLLAGFIEADSRTTKTSSVQFLWALIAFGALEVKIIGDPDRPGRIFHDKVGLIWGAEAVEISFIGSANESKAAIGPNSNSESFDVFYADVECERPRIEQHAAYFRRWWNVRDNDASGFRVLDASEALQEALAWIVDERELGSVGREGSNAIEILRDFERMLPVSWQQPELGREGFALL